jgi:hypothetical protein
VHSESRGKRIAGSLWAKDNEGKSLPPSIDDIVQGRLNDCYLMAALAAVVSSTPEKIVSLIHDQGGDVFTVHFKELGWAFASPSVTADFAQNQHAHVGQRKALWPLILEKAYAQVKGGLNNLKNGNPATVLDDMLGMKGSTFLAKGIQTRCWEP